MTRNWFLLLLAGAAMAQGPEKLTFAEYIGYVKKYHPLVKKADLAISRAEADLMAARGAFDPKLEVDYNTKVFKSSEYYTLLNSSFKIPTWYGIELKAAFDNAEGIYVNPEHATPNGGLTALGISVPVGRGLLNNERMANLRKAKTQIALGKSERQLMAAEAVYEAAVCYFSWKLAFDQVKTYQTYLGVAQARLDGISKLIAAGDKPRIDSVEARIAVSTRKVQLAEAMLKLAKARLDLSNYLWIDGVPVELDPKMEPEADLRAGVATGLNLSGATDAADNLESHPKISAMKSKLAMLEIERKLKANLLLPQIDLNYHYLWEPSGIGGPTVENYKAGVRFSFPVFLRKERGGLRLAAAKVRDGELDLELGRVALRNKLAAKKTEIASLEEQVSVIDEVVAGHEALLKAEERLFAVGESALFLINARENNLVGSVLSRIGTENRLLNAMAELFLARAGME